VNDGAAPARISIVAAAVSGGSTMVAVANTPDRAACQASVADYAALAGTPAGANLSASPLPGDRRPSSNPHSLSGLTAVSFNPASQRSGPE
jgi:hypothetical protein